jgi:hypothetical protein
MTTHMTTQRGDTTMTRTYITNEGAQSLGILAELESGDEHGATAEEIASVALAERPSEGCWEIDADGHTTWLPDGSGSAD